MSATCGPLFSSSSPSYSLTACLGSRLRALLDASGSPEYSLTWRHWDLGSGLPICALRASVRHTSGSASTSVPSGWATPKAQRPDQDTTYAGGNPTLARAAGWATPTANDAGGKPYTRDRGDKTRPRPTNLGLLAGWPSPTASMGGPEPQGATGRKLVTVAGWATPVSSDNGSTSPGVADRSRLKHQAPLACSQTGETPNGLSVSTGERGASPRLNPGFVCWLMGFPVEAWEGAGPD